MGLKTNKIPRPKAEANQNLIPPFQIEYGVPIPPLQRIQLFGHDEWEQFILEWADSLKRCDQNYFKVERCGGAGDKGRDIIASYEGGIEWDNYQCKHYNHPLQPNDVWIELGKLCYYTFIGEYTIPKNYYFISPKGIGLTLGKLLNNPNCINDKLLENWGKYCEREITKQKTISLNEIGDHIESFNFSIINYYTPLEIVEQHSKTPWYIIRFGGGLPQRPEPPVPPSTPSDIELKYTEALIDAYNDHLKNDELKISTYEDLKNYNNFETHFNNSRNEFYCAEALKEFSKDNLPLRQYEKLQDEINAGITDTISDPTYKDAFIRVIKVVKQAKSLPISNSPLISRISVKDKGGICHQLVNEERIKWIL